MTITTPMNPDNAQALPELLPCPFCGGKAGDPHIDDDATIWRGVVYCTDCGARAEGPIHDEDLRKSVLAWNTRAQPSTPSAEGLREACCDVIELLKKPLPKSISIERLSDALSAPANPAPACGLREKLADAATVFLNLEGVFASMGLPENHVHRNVARNMARECEEATYG